MSAPLITENIESNKQKFHSLSGQGYLIYESPDYSERIRVSLKVIVPDSLLLDIHGPMGGIYTSLLITDSHVTYYNRKDNEVYRGLLTSDVIRRLTGFSFTKSDIFDFFIGLISFKSDSSARLTFYPEDKSYRIFVEQFPFNAVYHVAKNGCYILDEKFYDTDGRVFMERSMEGFDRIEGMYLPRIVHYIEPRVMRQITMVHVDVRREINLSIPPERFEIPISEEAKRIPLPRTILE